jgi:hypothetical protein
MYRYSKKSVEGLLQIVLLAAIFSAGFFGYIMHSTDWFRAIPGDLFDARFNSVILEHLYQWVSGEAPKLWSPTFFYPFENVLAFSDNHFGSGWSYILFRLWGLQREYAYLGWFIVGNLLNFWVTFYVLRRLGFSILAAGVGAFVFTFALPALPKEAHAQLVYRFAVPLAFLAMYQFLQSKNIFVFVRVIFWLLIQFLCSIYLGVFLIYLLGIMTLVWILSKKEFLFSHWQTGQSHSKTAIGIAWILLFLLCSAIIVLLYQYQIVSLEYGFKRSLIEVSSMIPTMSSYFIADGSLLTKWIGQSFAHVSMRHEHQMFFGLGLLLVGMLGIYYLYIGGVHQQLGRIAAWTLFGLIVLTFSIHGYSIYKVLLYLPGVGSVRAVSRIVLIMLLPLGIIAAIAIDVVQQRFKKWQTRWAMLTTLVLLVVVESMFYQPYSTGIKQWVGRQNDLKARLPNYDAKDSIIFVTGNPDDPHMKAVELDGMIFAQDRHLPTLNGYSGNVPPAYLEPLPCISFQNRLNAYFDLFKKSNLNNDSLAKRVVLVPLVPCSGDFVVATNKTITVALASKIRLSIQAKVNTPILLIAVTIENSSDEIFSTLSTKGPIRLSWRFIQLDTEGRSKENSDWIERKDLSFALKPGQKETETLKIALPAQAGRYQLEVSLVQDGVAWFHDLGMVVPKHLVEVSR